MAMGEENPNLSGWLQGSRKGPDVVFHIRARIDQGDLIPTDEKGARPIQGEGPAVPSLDYSRLQGFRTSAALGGELFSQLVGYTDDGLFVLRREGGRLHGVEVDHTVDLVAGPNQDRQL